MYEKSIFVFRRDLRLVDNTGLIQALNNSKYVIPCFIYDENILKSKKNSEFRCNFLNESLVELDDQLKKKKSSLQIFHGKPEKIINDVIQSNNVDAVFLNTDFTDYSIKRDDKINKVCKNMKIDFHSTLDYLLHNPNDIKTNDEKPYTIYSHFYKKARQYTVRKVLKNSKSNFYSNSISKESIKSPTESVVSGGRNSAIQILKNLHNFRNYDKARNYPWMDSTTKLSAHNKFGTVSVREVYHAILEKLGKDHTLMGEIYWREFFSHILFHFPWAQRKSFKAKFQKIPWSKSEANFEKWCKGITGFPIVDAGIRELNGTGFMHNRARMVVASFLTKDLHIDWRKGDQYFAKKLVDYDPAVNSGNWQWAASTGCDAVPYFRIFNPWLQQQKFDSECQYIKRWIPELEEELPKTIHNLWKDYPANLKYPKPIIQHKVESQKTKEIFKSQ